MHKLYNNNYLTIFNYCLAENMYYDGFHINFIKLVQTTYPLPDSDGLIIEVFENSADYV